MSRFYTVDDANALLPDVMAVVARLRDQRDELVGLRDAYRERERVLLEGPAAGDDGAGDDRGGHPAGGNARDGADDPELRRLRLRMRGIVDQMQAEVAWLDERSLVLRDIGTGLLDFPALASGRQVWLCWRLGEAGVDYWHGHDEGFAGRRPLAQLPGAAARA